MLTNTPLDACENCPKDDNAANVIGSMFVLSMGVLWDFWEAMACAVLIRFKVAQS